MNGPKKYAARRKSCGAKPLSREIKKEFNSAGTQTDIVEEVTKMDVKEELKIEYEQSLADYTSQLASMR
jgi:hypothetical protein